MRSRNSIVMNKLDDAFRFQQQALGLLSRRQDILASNIANADTPGYQARDIDFTGQLKQAMENNSMAKSPVSLSLTSQRHIEAKAKPFDDSQLLYRVPDQPSADGNTVDMDRERVNFADNAMKYQSSLTFLGADIKKMMTVLSQG
ncbi:MULTISPECIES: flagellar basal body rod protein FlgB [Enterobacter]|uniref:flagellar basal body rod protein FlgB n=1 Tax=Enterobacter TaxID=547 RepID=UPI0003D81DA2|nr:MULTISPECIES: flagellar basal body rod protein FlgB [Enterobacter]AHE70058.1 flagellar biosynthesis protein FlgB [Enterobacter ludwigii]AOT43661.1 flagellar basal body rod protein FlgB [Enterobacter ludwigii]KIF86207.1 flagellar biosynthesis protein FlgB [Enterobacter ludwigii]KLP46859.1 flagellar biosynthesis protein FlgB [Enterobacter ludwigii]KUQ40523.1 flagellar biosynthesis protein FlgB [Enterobacter ludwigii]